MVNLRCQNVVISVYLVRVCTEWMCCQYPPPDALPCAPIPAPGWGWLWALPPMFLMVYAAI